MRAETLIGWDLGGAHLKAVALGGDGRVLAALQEPCPLWQGMGRFHAALDAALTRLGPTLAGAAHAVTMTGEMADNFASRAEGVLGLGTAFAAAVPGGGPVRLYAGERGWVRPDEAATAWRHIASANWHASASLVARRLPDALFIDIGSTTSDLIPIAGGRVAARGADDAGRLAHDELIYAGVVRTPLMALAERAPVEGRWLPLMAELFATTADVFRLTGQLDESADQHPAADGGAKTAEASAKRLARMVGAELDPADLHPWRELAAYFAGELEHRLWRACRAIHSRAGLAADAPVVGAGSGRFLAQRLAQHLGRPYVDVATLVDAGPAAERDFWLGTCASAFAVAWLAHDAGRPAVNREGAPCGW